MKCVIGVDPGATGAAIHLDLESSLLQHFDMPGAKEIPAHAMAQWMHEVTMPYRPQHVIVAIEAPLKNLPRGAEGSMASIAMLSRQAGAWEGIAASQGFRYQFVAPGTWKAYFSLRSTKARKVEKKESLVVAQREFPWSCKLFDRQRDIGRADAALIALWAARNLRMET